MMLKLAVVACLCAIVLVKGQEPPPSPPTKISSMEANHVRVARQSMPPGMPNPSAPGGTPNNNGNLGMQGLGNVPDPTAIIAKAQEIGRQFMSGRRRRQAGPPPPQPPPQGQPPMDGKPSKASK